MNKDVIILGDLSATGRLISYGADTDGATAAPPTATWEVCFPDHSAPPATPLRLPEGPICGRIFQFHTTYPNSPQYSHRDGRPPILLHPPSATGPAELLLVRQPATSLSLDTEAIVKTIEWRAHYPADSYTPGPAISGPIEFTIQSIPVPASSYRHTSWSAAYQYSNHQYTNSSTASLSLHVTLPPPHNSAHRPHLFPGGTGRANRHHGLVRLPPQDGRRSASPHCPAGLLCWNTHIDQRLQSTCAIPPPPLHRLAADFGQSLRRWAPARLPIVSRAKWHHRITTCQAFPAWSEDAQLSLTCCAICGCTKVKHWLGTETCPAGRW